MRGRTVAAVIFMIVMLVCVSRVSALQVDIIESQSFNPNDVMDVNWAAVATSMGHTATIRPQTDLDTGTFLTNSNLLIISSGLIPLTPTRQATIVNAMNMAVPVYLQCESNPGLTTNQTWVQLVNNYGSNFTWTGSVNNVLVPTHVSGTLSTTPNTVNTVANFTGGAFGNGSLNVIETNLHSADREFGWYFYPRVGIWIIAAANSDQEWVRTFANPQLMENYIDNLLNRNASYLQTRVWITGPPIVIPSTGGSFTCFAFARNNNSVSMLFDAWTQIQLPNGNIFGPLQFWTGLTIAPFTQSSTQTLGQFIPGFAPAGTYYYHVAVGSVGNWTTNLDALRVVKL